MHKSLRWYRALPKWVRALVTLAAALLAMLVVLCVGWLGYATVSWSGYGWLQVDRQRQPLLDRFLPAYEISERHEVQVAAPADVTYAAACALDLQAAPSIRAIFRAREVVLHAPQGEPLPTQLVAQTLRIGWGVLEERPGRILVMGAVT